MSRTVRYCGQIIKKKTFSKIAVLLGTGMAMATEVVGVCVLTGILDHVLHKS